MASAGTHEVHLAGRNGTAQREREALDTGSNDRGSSSKFGPKKPELSVVVPTRNEAGNIDRLVERLSAATHDLKTEVIFVDDSDDDTVEQIQQVARRAPCRIRLVHRRPSERSGGLGGAVVEGFRAAQAPLVVVMDADLQHPPELVPRLVDEASASEADLVVASRYCETGTSDSFGRVRSAVSQGSTAVTHLLFPRRLHGVSDPMSGFFLVRRSAVDLDSLRPRGFKILLEILVRTPGLRRAEVPFSFGDRHAGESKASVREGARFLSLLMALRFGGVSARFTRFGLVGVSGLAVNMLLLAALTDLVGLYYLASAVLATQGSTLWNFALAERWVFAGANHKRSRPTRLALFLGMNNAALALRGPMLVALVSYAGLNYLLANFISLVSLTLLRFALADAWIWAKERAATPIPTHCYDIHGIVTVESEVRLPELERFRTDRRLARPTIRVRIGRLSRAQSELVAALAFLARHTRYDERLGRFGFGVDVAIGRTIQVVASPLLKRSPHVLYTNVVEPILRWTFVKKGYALVHAAAVARGDQAFLITARTDTGKTTTILKLLDTEAFSFLSDDMTLLAPNGRVLTYPKPLTISRHTVRAVKSALLSRRERAGLLLQSRLHSRSGRRFAMILARSHLPVATINALVQLLVPPPKYHVDRLVPEVGFAQEAQLAGIFVIERGGEGEDSLSAGQALDILMTNCEDAYGFPPYAQIEGFLRSRNGSDLQVVERAIVGQALATIPATVLRSSVMDWAQRLPGVVDEVAPLPTTPQTEAGLKPAVA